MTTRLLFRKLVFLILLGLHLPLHAQMSGSYTLGGALSDYESFTDAVNDLRVQGLAADVEFRVRPDTYHNVRVDNIPNDSNYHILFVYDGTPGDSAVISGQLKVINTRQVTFKRFTILPRENQRTSCVTSELSNYFTLDSCRVLNLYNCDFDYDEGLIKLNFPWEGAYMVTYIRNCEIRSAERTFYYGGSKGSVWIEGNTITGTIVNGGNQGSLFAFKFHYYDNIFYCTSDNFKQ
ncbi:MAG: hypothetical protein L3J31_00560, partial [Bacteroidales bacterium]|nr:hypothetical protein [Bacteroidales bacterium]